MSQFPKTLAAAKRAEKTQWALGDALLEEIGRPRATAAQDAAFSACAVELHEAGMPYTPGYLRDLRNIADKFNPEVRVPGLGVKVAIEAGTPAVLNRAVRFAEQEGKPVTERLVGQVRAAAIQHERRTHGRQLPKRDPERARTVSKASHSELRHHADVLALSGLAGRGADAARRYVTDIAGASLSRDERDELLEDIDKTIEAWRVARAATRDPLSSEIEAFLRTVS